jgi:hypothetical protein
MGLDKQGRLDILAAQRGPLEHALYAAQVNTEVKEEAVKHGATGVTQEEVEQVKAERDGIQAQIDVIDENRKNVKREADDES